ncbi:Fur-regulated basic protein FbpA [Metabacillus sp. FJAT-53654]|uniref:Fur-regulated basic protein FbpA n=1 Tax=Metabacillus rhizosphaerae TaxID=3117747 RepID=A0ABZ2MY43_9BACI
MTQLREAVSKRKEKLIQKLLDLGVYKKEEHHLYELTLSEIETEYQNERKRVMLIENPKI